ncbi:SH3 domain-containing protein [Paeniglutamicibacter sp. NPDC091659]|uniref:SH3 domain-containing protein n=1 Tax=Paeniglutamicibacter sp. NPDC091659 TaxID=3364389 RepID=UPI0037F9CBBE
MTTTSGGQVRRLRLPAALLTAALIATPALAAPAFAAPSALATTTLDASGVEPAAESEPDPAPASAPAAPVTGESLQQVAVSGVDAEAAESDESREEAAALTPPDASDAGATIAPTDLNAAATEPDPTDDDQLAALTAERTTEEFTAAGLTWTPDENDEVIEAAVRVREDGTWSDWTSLEMLNPGSEGEGATAGTEPVLSLGADGIQARVLTASGQAPANLEVNLVAAGTSATDGALTAAASTSASTSADGAALKPSVITRKQWGARETQANTTARRSAKLQAMYVHHTASSNNYTEAQAFQQIRGIYDYHTKVLKWDDIGYQFLVDRFGNIYEGRRGSMTDLIVGAQAGGYNANTIGVSAMGNFDDEDDPKAKPPKALVEAVTRLLAWKGYQYNLDVTGTTTLTTSTAGPSTAMYKNGVKVTVPVILGHKRTNNTSCPGRYLDAKLGSIRTEVSKRIAKAKATYGTARPVLKAPVASGNYSSDSPVSRDGKIKLSWKPVSKATKYQVMVRSLSDERIWWAGKTATGTSADVTIAPGETAIFGIRARDDAGRVGATTRLVQSTRAKAPAVTLNYTRWTTAGLNLRKSPDADSDRLLTIPTRKKITVTATSGNWSRTTYGGKSGWVSSSYISAVAPPAAKKYRYALINTRLVKSASSSAATVVGVGKHEKLQLLKASGSWSQAKLGSKTGWVKTSKLSATAPKGKIYRYAAINTKLVKSASSSAAKVASLPKRKKVQLLKTGNAWSKVKLGSKTGWVKSWKLSSKAPKRR